MNLASMNRTLKTNRNFNLKFKDNRYGKYIRDNNPRQEELRYP